MNVLLKIGYIGTAYHGFQKQSGDQASIQGVLEEALETIHGCATKVMASGRTDAGVHARGQRVQFRGLPGIDADRYPRILNNMLPADIRVYWSWEVPEGFHVRYGVLEKTYSYRFDLNPVPALYTLPFALHVPYPVDRRRMEEALGSLVGTHDFKAYASSFCEVEDCVRTISRASLEEGEKGEEKGILTLTLTGSGFLHNMVRIIAGTLLDIGRGKLETDVFARAFEGKDRSMLGRTAAPRGLTLESVRYKEEEFND